MPYILMQDRLSTGGSFILCDAGVDGFPIRYASQGFVDLFEFKASECLGKRCGDLVGKTEVSASDPAIVKAGRDCGFESEGIEQALTHMTAYAGGQCKKIAADPLKSVGYALVLNRRKGGEIFVNELVMLMHRHPVFGWTYSVGLQSDATPKVSVKELLKAAYDPDKYESLVQRHEVQLQGRLSGLGVQSDEAIRYLHEKAAEMWSAFMLERNPNAIGFRQVSDTSTATPSVEGGARQTSCAATSTIPDNRTESEMSASSDEESEDELDDEDQAPRTEEGITGVWCGVASKALGGYEQQVEFFGDGNLSLLVMGQCLNGRYSLDRTSRPYQLDITLDTPTSPGMAPPEPVLYIAQIDVDGLHLCCDPFSASKRPTTFGGAGYILMRPGHAAVPKTAETSETSTRAPASSDHSRAQDGDAQSEPAEVGRQKLLQPSVCNLALTAGVCAVALAVVAVGRSSCR